MILSPAGAYFQKIEEVCFSWPSLIRFWHLFWQFIVFEMILVIFIKFSEDSGGVSMFQVAVQSVKIESD